MRVLTQADTSTHIGQCSRLPNAQTDSMHSFGLQPRPSPEHSAPHTDQTDRINQTNNHNRSKHQACQRRNPRGCKRCCAVLRYSCQPHQGQRDAGSTRRERRERQATRFLRLHQHLAYRRSPPHHQGHSAGGEEKKQPHPLTAPCRRGKPERTGLTIKTQSIFRHLSKGRHHLTTLRPPTI